MRTPTLTEISPMHLQTGRLAIAGCGMRIMFQTAWPTVASEDKNTEFGLLACLVHREQT